jgi:transcriptional regulator with XRE-family HTH domain
MFRFFWPNTVGQLEATDDLVTTAIEMQDHNADVYQHVGQQLRAHRIGRGMTQSDTARLIGVSPQQYQKYEDAQTKCSLNNLITLAQFYDIAFSDLLPDQADTSQHSEADLLARLVAAFSSLRDTREKLRLVQLVEAIRNSHNLEFD